MNNTARKGGGSREKATYPSIVGKGGNVYKLLEELARELSVEALAEGVYKGQVADLIGEEGLKALLKRRQLSYDGEDRDFVKFSKTARERMLDGNGGGRGKKSKARKLIELAEENTEIIRDEHNKAFAAIKQGDSLAILPVRSADFKAMLHGLLWEREGEPSNSEATQTALLTLEAMALKAPQYELHLRVAWDNGDILYDPGRDDWQIIRITRNGWTWEPHSKPVFRRYKHMKPQVDPDPQAKPEAARGLLEHILVGDGDGMIYLAMVASFFVPEIPHPLPVMAGPQGSCKTTAQEFTRQVVDPSSLGTLSIPKDLRELLQKLQHNYIAFFDNVTRLSREQSDMLCRAVTGNAQSKRELYSDDEDVYYKFVRVVGTNGLNVSATFPDFLDRAVIFGLERPPLTQRQTITAVAESYELSLPKNLGGFLAAVSKALPLVEQVGKELQGKLPRMADFAIWGEALSRAMGFKPMQFYTAYMDKLTEQNREVISGDVIGELVIKWLSDQAGEIWTGSASELLEELHREAKEYGLEKSKGFPKAPNTLSRKINELSTNLAEEGIKVERFMQSNGSRQIKIARVKGEIEIYRQISLKPLTAVEPGPAQIQRYYSDTLPEKRTAVEPLYYKPGPVQRYSDNSGISRGFSETRLTPSQQPEKNKPKGKVKIAVNTLHRMQVEAPGRSFTTYNLIVELHERKNMTYPTAEQAVSKAIDEGFIPYDEKTGTLGAV